MTSSVFSYDESVAGDAQSSLRGVITGVEGSLSDLDGFVKHVKSNWDGDEMTIYEGIQAKWDSAAATVKEILTSVSTALESTTTSVQDMRGQVRSTLQKS